MKRKITFLTLCATLFALCSSVEALQAKVYRVGVIHQGGPYKAVVDGLRDGLRQSGMEEGKHFVLDIRDAKGDLKAVEEAARNFEREKANLIYAVTTSAVTAVKNVTSKSPIVFAVGSDPVASGLVQSFGKPGGRLTGVQYSATDLTGKRLEILKEMLPKLSRVVIIYIGALKAKEADAYFYISDAMLTSQAQLVIDMAMSKKLPTMFAEQNLVAMGGLASYGQNFHETGRLSAKYVQKIMTGHSRGPTGGDSR